MNDELLALRAEFAIVTRRLQEAEATLEAIRVGDVDALIIQDPHGGDRILSIYGTAALAETVFDQSSEAIVVCDSAGLIVRWNQVAAGLAGIHPQLQPFDDVFCLMWSGDGLDSVGMKTIRDVLSGQGARAVEAALTRPDGSTAHLVVSAQPLVVPIDNFRGALVLMVDVTRRREAEEIARRSALALREGQRMEGIGRLAGGIAHEFNNVLTAINGYADLALTLRKPETTYHCLGEILEGGERLAILTRQLLSYSRKQVMLPRQVDLNTVIAEMDQLLNKMVIRTVALTFEFAPEPMVVKVDASQIQQVVINVVLNACDAMPRGGKLAVATRRQVVDEDQPGPEDLPAGRWIVLKISDTGQGMTEEVRAHLFEPFFTTKAIGQGTGLGLSVVHGIVRQSGGYVTVQTAAGHGARFEIWLREHPVAVPQRVSGDGNPVGTQEEAASMRLRSSERSEP